MVSVFVAIAVAILTFAGGLAGMYAQRLLPDQHSVEKSRDMIGAVIGLVTLLLALVLGTLIGNTYYFSATQQSELQTLSAHSLLLDKALAQYGPETKPMRDRIKEALVRNYETFWQGGDADPQKLTAATAMADLQPMGDYLNSLDPKTPEQKRAVSSAQVHFGAVRTDAVDDILTTRRSIFSTALDCRDRLVGVSVLRLRFALPN